MATLAFFLLLEHSKLVPSLGLLYMMSLPSRMLFLQIFSINSLSFYFLNCTYYHLKLCCCFCPFVSYFFQSGEKANLHHSREPYQSWCVSSVPGGKPEMKWAQHICWWEGGKGRNLGLQCKLYSAFLLETGVTFFSVEVWAPKKQMARGKHMYKRFIEGNPHEEQRGERAG